MLLVGSYALYLLNIVDEFNDIDFICSSEEWANFIKTRPWTELKTTQSGAAAVIKGQIFEAEFTDKDNPTSQKVHDLPEFDSICILGGALPVKLASKHTLLLLKSSHKYKKTNSVSKFEKTYNDIIRLKTQGAVIENEQLLFEREAYTYNYTHPSLNQSKDDFFNADGIEYEYDHDSIHEAIKHLVEPAYKYYMHEDAEVFSDKDKFFAAPEEVRLFGVLEEAYVLALERAVIPCGADPNEAFRMALVKVCTSITSGWFREYAWNNYRSVKALYDPEYVDKFLEGVANGTVKAYTP